MREWMVFLGTGVLILSGLVAVAFLLAWIWRILQAAVARTGAVTTKLEQESAQSVLVTRYYTEALRQAESSYNMSMVFAALGFVLLVASMFLYGMQATRQYKGVLQQQTDEVARLDEQLRGTLEPAERVRIEQRKDAALQRQVEILDSEGSELSTRFANIVGGFGTLGAALVELIAGLFFLNSRSARKDMVTYLEALREDARVRDAVAMAQGIVNAERKETALAEISRAQAGGGARSDAKTALRRIA